VYDPSKTNQELIEENSLLQQKIKKLEEAAIDHKKAEEASRKLASVVRYSRELVNLAKPDGQMVFLNDAGKKMLGLTEEDLAQIKFIDVIPEHLHDKVQQEVFPSIERDGFWEGDLQYLNLATGALSDVHAITYKITDPETGEMQFLANVSLDITDKKRILDELETHRRHLEKLIETRTVELASAMEKLKTSEERFEYALEASNDGLWDWNIKNNRTYCNPAYFRMLGYEPGEIDSDVRSIWIDLMHPEDRERVLTIANTRLEKEGAYEIEFRMRTRDGQYKWILSRGKVVSRDENGHPVRAVGTHTDMTTYKQLEIELRRISEEQRAIVETATTGIVLIRNRSIVYCNKRMEEIFGYGPGELTGRTTRCWYENDDDFFKMGVEIAAQMADPGIFRKERLLRRKDGSRFWARMTSRSINRSDASLGLVGIVEDITTERETMEALRTAKESAETADRLKSAFLATMSHELRTPLNSIIGFTGILLQRLGGPLNDEQEKQLKMVYNSARHLLDLINDVLDISKIEAEQLNVVSEDFPLRDSVEKVIKSSQPLADRKGIELSANIAPDIGQIKSDRRRVEQILLNLISNAVKFTEQGFVRLDCKVLENKIVLAVSDSGIGIKQEDMGMLFNAFRQIESGITRKYDGTGLGLSISRKLAHLLGGKIEVESTWGKGSTFSLILPHEGGGV